MRNQLLGFAIAVAQMASAQVWCPPGAQWHYEHWGMFGNQLGSVHVQYIADTMVQGVSAKRLSCTASGYDFLLGQPYLFTWPNLITRSDQGQVSRWNGSEWLLHFDLDAPVGGQWTLSGDNFTERTVTVLTTGTISIQGEPLAYSTVSFDPPFSGIATDSIIERIGYRQLYLDPVRTVALDGDVFGVRCYSDGDLAYSTTGGLACDHILAAPEAPALANLSLWPNPASDAIWLSGMPGSFPPGIAIRDALGRLALCVRLQPGAPISIGSLPDGLYTLIAQDANGARIAMGRFLKE